MVDDGPVHAPPAPLPRLRSRRVGGFAIAVTALLAACSSDADGGATTTAATLPATAAPTSAVTTTPPTTTLPPTTTSTSTTTTLPPTTTTTIVTSGAVVLVANAAGVPGAAAKLTGILTDLGFETRDGVNAAGAEESLELSRVYYLPDARRVAMSVSFLMGDVPMFPMPTPPPIVDALDALGDATVLVMLGTDLAGEELPDRG